ncbi:ClpB-like protein [hydrothermal vent metagenome]|uniref:ClpB-like protein n=1 Tax=hydrothermal vent metagenome TaxID=652676 RepID=A0A3B0YDJ2_9ZZZZ
MIILLDEVEKAHHDVLNMFYQVFDRGFMRDGEGREIDFKNTVILMTSNIGSEEIAALFNKTINKVIEDLENQDNPQENTDNITPEKLISEDGTISGLVTPTYGDISLAVEDSLKNHFPPALIGRMQTIAYQPLDKDTLQVSAFKTAPEDHQTLIIVCRLIKYNFLINWIVNEG